MLVCAEPEDTPAVASKMVDKVLKLRIFADDQGRYVVPEFMCC
jgi:D-tyrosyl-tRNA(Tyr) deacylase